MPKSAQNPSRVWHSPAQLPAGDAPTAERREADTAMGPWEGAAGHSPAGTHGSFQELTMSQSHPNIYKTL